MAHYDVGDQTVKEILEKRMGPEAAGRVLKEVNDAYQQGKRGEELHQLFRDAIKREGYQITSNKNDILYGFIYPAVMA